MPPNALVTRQRDTSNMHQYNIQCVCAEIQEGVLEIEGFISLRIVRDQRGLGIIMQL